VADKDWIIRIAVPLKDSDVLEPTGRYEFGWYGYVDFDTKQNGRCGCGGCCIAERIPDDPDFSTSRLLWLDRIRKEPSEPDVLRVTDLGCPCCQRSSDLCLCDVRKVKLVDLPYPDRQWQTVCLTHHVKLET
jgi:hypothetical protein